MEDFITATLVTKMEHGWKVSLIKAGQEPVEYYYTKSWIPEEAIEDAMYRFFNKR